jgi:hypothetical protein
MSNATIHVGDGGHFDTLNHALTDEVAAYANLTADCHGTGSAGILTICCHHIHDTAAATVSTAWTADANSYINIIGNPSDKTASNTGVWSADRYTLGPSSGHALTIGEAYTRLVDMQIAAASGTDTYLYGITGAAANCFVYRTIIKNGNASITGRRGVAFSSSAGASIVNCIIYDFAGTGASGVYGDSADGLVRVYSTTIANCTIGIYSGYNVVTAKNVIAQCTDGFSGSLKAGCVNNLSSTASDVPTDAGGNSHNSVTLTFKDAANDDYHLASSDTDAIDGGYDTSGESAPLNFTDDIDGTTRSTWDIGADEYVAAAAALSIPKLMAYYRSRRVA